jgi:AcrR family transcriptional regulator
MSPAIRRQAILDAARNVAMRKGLGSTTVRGVAKEMGTSSGLIHHYFRSMDELHAAVFEIAAEEDLRNTRKQMDLAETATGRLTAYFAAFADPDNDAVHQLWLDTWSEAGRNQLLRVKSAELNLEWQELLADVIRLGVTSGEFQNVDVDAVAWKALSLLDGLSLQIIAHPNLLERQVAARWAANSTEQDLGLPVDTVVRGSVVS